MEELEYKILDIVKSNNLENLILFFNEYHIISSNFNNFNKLLIYAIECASSNVSNNDLKYENNSITKYILNQRKDKNLNYYIHENNQEKVPLFICISKNNFKIANLLIKNNANINYKINNISIIDYLIKNNCLNKTNLKYILSKGYIINGFDNDFIIQLIKSGKNDLLKIIFKYYSINKSLIISLLRMYKNNIKTSHKKLLHILLMEKCKINITEKMYESENISQNDDGIKLLFEYDTSDPEELFCRINNFGLLEKAVRMNDTIFVNNILKYYKFNLKEITSGNMIVEAMKNENMEIIKLLIGSLVKSCTNSSKNNAPYFNLFLNIAIEIKSIKLVKYIIEESEIKNEIDINNKDIYNKYPLIVALYSCNLDIFKLLLDNDASCNIKDYEGKSLLSLAIDIFPDVVKYILRNSNININEKDLNGNYPFIKSIYKNNYNNTVLLLKYAHEHNIDMKIKDTNGNTPLILSYRLNLQKIFRFLIMYFDVNEKDASGNSLLYYADVLVSLIQSKYLLVNKPNIHGEVPLISIINDDIYTIENKEIIINELIKRGANVNFTDIKGNTALVYAIRKKYTTIIKLLIEYGSNVNHISGDRNKSILMEAIENNELSIVKILIKFGANINYKNMYGESAFITASNNENSNIFEYLMKYNSINCTEDILKNIIQNNKQNLLDIINQHHCISYTNSLNQ
eukprot:jgi/Orpsp1_1/1186405/evm.model.d7180000050285.1